MKPGRNPWATYLSAVLVALLSTGLAATARAADDDKKDGGGKEAVGAGGVTGTWRWSFTTQDGQERATTLKLKQDGEKLTGAVSGRNNQETEIQDGKVKDGQVSFKVVRKFNDREMTSTYNGKLDGDTIKGKIETTGGEQARTRDWEAKRVKDDGKPADKAGDKPEEKRSGT